MEIRVPSGSTIVSSPFIDVDFKFDSALEQRLNNFYGLGGELQKFADSEFMNGIKDYVPFKTGTLRDSMTLNTILGSGEVVFKTPYARYLYYGMLMVDSVTGSAWSPLGGTKVLTETPLQYHGGSKAGAFWDRRWKADNIMAYVKSLQDFVDRNG